MHRSKIHWVLTWTILVTALISGCDVISPASQAPEPTLPPVKATSGVIAEGSLVPAQYVNLSFNAGGQVAEVLVAEGDRIEDGQVIAKLSHYEQAASAVAKAEIEVVSAQQALKDLTENANVATAQALQSVASARDAVRHAQWHLDSLKAGSKPVDINSAQADVVILKDQLDEAQKDFNNYRRKPEDNVQRAVYLSKLTDAQRKYDNAVSLLNNLEGPATDIDMAIGESNLALAEARLEFANQEYEDVKDGPNPDDLALAQSRLTAAETGLEAATEAQDDIVLSAPFTGTVVSLKLKAGEQAVPGQPVVVLADLSQWIVETDDLTEMEVPQIGVGQQVEVTPDAIPDLKLAGVVQSISDLNQEYRGDVTYTTKIALQDGDPRLRWGMTMMVTFGGE